MDRPLDDLKLIETLRFDPNQGFLRLRLHLARLHRSARRLGFAPPVEAAAGLQQAVAGATGPLRVRLTSDAHGHIDITSAPFTPLSPDAVWKVRIANTRLQSTDKLLRVKTTRRDIYEAARAEYTAEQADDVLMLNERGDVCEGTITSVFLDDGSGMLRTPPIACGLLAGVLRTELICQRKARVGRISIADFKTGKVFMGNSLRGLVAAEIMPDWQDGPKPIR